MAKKYKKADKAETVETVETPTPPDELDYNALHEADADTPVNMEPEVGSVETPEVAPEPTKEETPEPTVETVEEPTPEPESTKVLENLVKVTESLVEKQTEVAPTEPEKDELESIVDAKLVDFRARYGRDPETYAESTKLVAEAAAEVAKSSIAKETKASEEARQAEAEASKKAEEEATQQAVSEQEKYWEEQTQEMVSEGVLETDDQGELTRDSQKKLDALYAKMSEVSDQRVKGGLRRVISLWEVYSRFYEDPTKQPDGANAPVAGAGSRATQPESSDIDYARLHGWDARSIKAD